MKVPVLDEDVNMLEIEDFTTSLKGGDEGLWLASHRAEVSHPEECQDWYRSVEDDSFWYRHRAACIVDCMRQFPPCGPVLDVGGGNGHVSAAVQQAGFEAMLLEPSLQAAQNAKARGIKRVICATLAEAGLKDQSLSAVGAFDVLEHVEDDAGFLADVRRILRPAGRFYVTVPAWRFLWSAYDEQVGHFRRYTVAALSRLLRGAGLQPERATYLYGLLPLPIFCCRSLPSLLRRRHATDFEQFQREYAPSRSPARTIMEHALRGERAFLRRGGRLPFGSSCLIVARAG